MSKARRNEIVAAAARMFNAQGYHRTSMADIAEAVGMLKGSLYYYFQSKDELLYEVIVTPLQRLIDGMEAASAAAAPAAGAVGQAIRRHIELSAEYYPNLFVIAQERFDFLGEPYRSRIMKLHRRYRTLWLELIRRGVESGEFRPGLDVSISAFAILGMCNWMHRWFRPDGPLNPQEIARGFAEIALAGLLSTRTPEARPSLDPR